MKTAWGVGLPIRFVPNPIPSPGIPVGTERTQFATFVRVP